MMGLPTEGFRDNIPPHYTPPVNHKSLYQVALLAQTCKSDSFDNQETGGTDEIPFWLRVASSNAAKHINGADIMLPSMHRFDMASSKNSDS